MGWTRARLLAYKGTWFSDCFDYNGPACYELGTGGPRGGNIQWHYVGHTKNEKNRMCRYGRDGSHLSKIIDYHINQGWCIHYRSWSRTTKEAAEKMERSMLRQFTYDWNKILNHT